MKIICLLNSVYPNFTGGRETWIYNVCNRLCEQYDISVITEKPYKKINKDGKFEDIDNRVKIYPVTILRNYPIIGKFLRSYINYFSQLFSQHSMKQQLKKVLDNDSNEKYCVISFDTVFMGSIGRWAKKQYDNVTYISSVRGPHAEITGEYYPLLRKYFLKNEKKNLDIADQIWANGYDTKQNLKLKNYESIVIKNGLDIKKAINEDNSILNDIININEPKILTIGSLLDIKGYNELIQAIAYIHKHNHIKIHLIALGKGDKTKYMNLAVSLGVKEYVHFLGEDRRTITYAKKANIAACLSGGGGLSMACLESLASKTPVIAWNSPVYLQMIEHKKSGYLVKEKDSIELAKGIVWLLEHPVESKQYGVMGYKVAEQYDWDFVIRDIVNQLKNIVTD